MVKLGYYNFLCFATLLVVATTTTTQAQTSEGGLAPRVLKEGEEDILEVSLFGDNKARIPRKVFHGEPVGEIFLTYRECSKQGIRRHNDTHIFFPFDTMLTAEYAKIRNDDKNEEAGVVKQVFVPQGYQAVFKTAKNKPIAFAVEKFHALHMGGTKIETASKCPTNRDPEDDKRAREKLVFRNRLLTKLALLAKAAPLGYNSMTDVHHNDLLDEFQDNDEDFELPDVDRVRNMTKDVEEKLASGSAKPLKSNQECLHFNDHSGIELAHDGMYYPLDKTNVNHKGEAVNFPQRHIGMMSGVSRFAFNAKKDTLEMQLLISSRGYLSMSLDDIKASTSGFAVSPVDGKGGGKIAKPGGRPPMPEVSTVRYMAMKALRMLISNYPEDYKIMDEDHDAVCPKEFAGKVNGYLKRFDTKAFFELLDKAGLTNSIGILDDALNVLHAWGQAGLCSNGYIKGAEPGLFGFNFVSVVGIVAHGAMEIPYKLVMKTLGRQDWNTLEIQPRDQQLKEEEEQSYLAKVGEKCEGDLDCVSGECYGNMFDDDKCECNSGKYRGDGHSGCGPAEECIEKSWGMNYCLPEKRKMAGEACKDDKECQSLSCDKSWWNDEGTCDGDDTERRGLRS